MTVINGYTLLSELRTDDAGSCSWAFCKKNGKEYFIKEFINPPYPVDPGSLTPALRQRKLNICEKFYTEKSRFYSQLDRCRSGNIIVVSDFFRHGSRYYAVSEKVDSQEKDPRVIASLPNEQKHTLICSIAYSFSKLHDAGVVHADVKPANILLKKTTGNYYTAKIIDFDAGFLVYAPPNELCGDFNYLSPEMYLRDSDNSVKVDEKIDVFALGILFHEYWTGKLPDFPEDYGQVFMAVLDGQHVHVSRSVPDPLRTMIKQMLSLDPSKRPSARAVHQALTNGVLPSGSSTFGLTRLTDLD